MTCWKRSNFGFECGAPHKFVISQWQSSSNGCLEYLIYVWTLAIYFNFVLILSIYTADECNQVEFYLIYMTNWNVMLNALSSLFGAVVITIHFKNNSIKSNSSGDNRMTKTLKVHWLLSNLSVVVSICVSLAYWPTYSGRDAGLNDVLTHAVNSVILFLDTFIHARPPRCGHFVYPLGFGFFYLILFSLPYQLLGGLNRDYKNYVYPSLDWSDNTIGAIKSTAMYLASLVLVHLAITIFILIRMYVHGKFCKSENVPESNRERNEQSAV